jgi:ferredoxin-NADP reductase
LLAVDGAPPQPFRPGQYLTFSLEVPGGLPGAAGASASEHTITRCYSLSDRPDPSGHRVTVKRVLPPTPQPALLPGIASGHFHDRVHEGDVLQVKAPSGHFFIDVGTEMPAVFIAGGVGITPMVSMLRWCVAEQPERRAQQPRPCLQASA